MATFGERTRELLAEPEIAGPLDTALRRLASRLDPTDTDEGLEQVQTLLSERLGTVVTDLAVRRGWRLPK